MSFFFNDELNVNGTTIDSTEIGFLDGVSAGTAQANKALVISSLPSSSSKVLQSTTGGVLSWVTMSGGSSITINNNSDNNLVTATGSSSELNGETNLTFDGSTLNVTGSISVDTSITLDSTTINATEIGYLDGVTAGTASANKALVISSLPSSNNKVLKSTSGGVLSWGTSETRSTTNLNFIAEEDNFYTIYSSNSIVVILPEITSSNQGSEICFALVQKSGRNVQFYPSIGSNQKFLDDFGMDSSSISNSNSTVEILKYKSIFYSSDGVTFSISNAGSGYSSTDNVMVSLSGNASCNISFRTGVVQSVTINNGGSGYSNDDFLNFSNGTGFQGRLIVNSSGVITDVIILNGGYNYSSSDFGFSDGGSGSGSNANITLNVSGLIPVITSQSSGSDYTSVPTISVTVTSSTGGETSGSNLAVTGTLNKGLWVPIINTGTT